MTDLVLILLASLVAAVVLSIWLGRRRSRIWRRFARRYGLSLIEGEAGAPSRVEGHVGERSVTLGVTDASSDTGLMGVREIELKIELLTPAPTGLRVVHLTGVEPLTGVETVNGETDIAVGDRSFDDQALVTAPDADAARAWLTPERREALLELLGLPEPNAAGLAGGCVFLEERRVWASLRHLEDRLVLLLRVARRLDLAG